MGGALEQTFSLVEGLKVIKQRKQVDEICVDFDVVHLTDNFDLEIHIYKFPTSLIPNDDYRHHLDPMYLYGFLSEQNVPHTDFRGLRPTLGTNSKVWSIFRGYEEESPHPYSGGAASSVS